jgi:hypothetical protein
MASPRLPGSRHAAAPLAALLLAACGEFAPQPMEGASYLSRVQTQEQDGVRVTVAALSDEESRRYLGLDLAREGVQPVWFHVENRTGATAWFLPIGTDPVYFAPFEVAWMFHRPLASERNARIDEHLLSRALPEQLPLRGPASGFLFTHKSEGAKFIRAQVLSSHRLHEMRFIAPVPGGKWDFEEVDFSRLVPQASVRALEVPQLGAVLASMPPTATDAEGKEKADPLNLVLVGDLHTGIFPFVTRGWGLTEPFDLAAAGKSVAAFLLGRTYASSPVSPLYVFGRPQDIALQKPRNSINQRNHLRLWLTAFTVGGKPVWLGQISRDVGVRFTTKSWYLTTHKIDPDVDEARDYLLQDLGFSGYVARIGYAPGVIPAPRSAPRHNLTGDPYFTDGNRLVVFLDDVPGPVTRAELVTW